MEIPKIEKGVPVPALKATHSWIPLVEAMVEGDSVVVESEKVAQGLVVAMNRKGIRIRTAKEPGEPGGRVRVWHNGVRDNPVEKPAAVDAKGGGGEAKG